MLATDEEALICDLAETYQIFDYKRLPPLVVAVFSLGLNENSRIKMAINNQQVPINTLILASIFDKVNLLVWAKTKDAQHGKKQPSSLAAIMTGHISAPKNQLSFSSGEEFERARNKLLGKEDK